MSVEDYQRGINHGYELALKQLIGSLEKGRPIDEAIEDLRLESERQKAGASG